MQPQTAKTHLQHKIEANSLSDTNRYIGSLYGYKNVFAEYCKITTQKIHWGRNPIEYPFSTFDDCQRFCSKPISLCLRS